MGVRGILLLGAGAAVAGAVVYLVFLVDEEPETPAVRAKPTAQRNARVAPARATKNSTRMNKVPPLPEYMQEGLQDPPKPWQARSEPAKAHALFVGVPDDDLKLAERVSLANHAFRKRKYDKAIDESIALLQEIPQNQQLRRIIVRSACLGNRSDIAKEYMLQVSPSDQHYLVRHCRTYGDPNDWPNDPPFGVQPDGSERPID